MIVSYIKFFSMEPSIQIWGGKRKGRCHKPWMEINSFCVGVSVSCDNSPHLPKKIHLACIRSITPNVAGEWHNCNRCRHTLSHIQLVLSSFGWFHPHTSQASFHLWVFYSGLSSWLHTTPPSPVHFNQCLGYSRQFPFGEQDKQSSSAIVPGFRTQNSLSIWANLLCEKLGMTPSSCWLILN